MNSRLWQCRRIFQNIPTAISNAISSQQPLRSRSPSIPWPSLLIGNHPDQPALSQPVLTVQLRSHLLWAWPSWNRPPTAGNADAHARILPPLSHAVSTAIPSRQPSQLSFPPHITQPNPYLLAGVICHWSNRLQPHNIV